MWNDKETNIDLLDFRHLVAGVLSIINDHALLPATIGVFGDWGSGKSSLLKMVQAEIAKQKGVVCISFNGWLFEGYDDAKSALLTTIVKEISEKQGLPTKAVEKVKLLFKQINWMRVAIAIGKIGTAYYLGGVPAATATSLTDIPDLAKKIAESFGGTKPEDIEAIIRSSTDNGEPSQLSNVRDFHHNFAELIKLSEINKLVVLIDDLDRCNPDTVIETLEAIRLFLYTPDTVFILAADERLVRYSVSRKYPDIEGLQSAIGRDYLEKLVQFPVTVPPLGAAEIETYMKLLFISKASLQGDTFNKIREIALGNDAENLFAEPITYSQMQSVLGESAKQLAEDIDLAEFLAPILSVGLAGNPRQTKRFLNTLLFRQKMAEGRGVNLKTKILSKLMLLEYFKPETFRRLAEIQASQGGKPIEIVDLEKSVQADVEEPVNTNPKPALKDPQPDSSDILNLWKNDVWIRDWLTSDPKLANEDLRPYFYFSRDVLSPQKEAIKRLSPISQEIVKLFASASETHKRTALEKAKTISASDAASVFDVLAKRIRSSEEKEQNTMNLLDFVEIRKELESQLLSFLDSQSAINIPIAVAPRLKSVVDDPNLVKNLNDLFDKWRQDKTNKPLAAAAKLELEGNKAT